MKKIEYYMSFDNQDFDLEKDCREYEHSMLLRIARMVKNFCEADKARDCRDCPLNCSDYEIEYPCEWNLEDEEFS